MQVEYYGMARASQPFDAVWGFENDIKKLYPECTRVKYGEPYKSAGGKDLCDWIAYEGRREIARHTMLFMQSKRTGNQYAVVSRQHKAQPPSDELKALMNKIAAEHGH